MSLEGKGKPIFVGSLIVGLGPFIPIVNLACCLIPLLGGVAAVAVYKETSPPTFSNSDGLVLGGVSGAAGTAVYALLIVPVTMLVGSSIGGFLAGMTPVFSNVPENTRRILDFFFSNIGTVVGIVLFFKVIGHLALALIFGMLGGVVGIALLRPKAPASI